MTVAFELDGRPLVALNGHARLSRIERRLRDERRGTSTSAKPIQACTPL